MSNNEYLKNLFVGMINVPERLSESRTSGSSGVFDKSQYDAEKVKAHCQQMAELHPEDNDYNNPVFLQAVEQVLENGRYSAFMLQRKLNIGFNMATRYIDKIRNILSDC